MRFCQSLATSGTFVLLAYPCQASVGTFLSPACCRHKSFGATRPERWHAPARLSAADNSVQLRFGYSVQLVRRLLKLAPASYEDGLTVSQGGPRSLQDGSRWLKDGSRFGCHHAC